MSRTAGSKDRHFMRRALVLARRALGATAPNPAVGCVIVQDGAVVGEGFTQPGGRPHAEAVALAAAGERARGATAYVTLEPCAHHGRTPPCAEALVRARVARVVVASGFDPDPRVAGQGLAILRAAGVAVETGLLDREASTLNAGFFMRVTRGRPLTTLKLAMSVDGRIATRTGASQWITGPVARAAVHRLRARHDAVMVGIGTVLADDPLLTSRVPRFAGRRGLRIVADTRLRMPERAKMLADAARHPVLLLVGESVSADRVAGFAARPGVEVLACREGSDGRIDLADALQHLGSRGLTRVLVEAGGQFGAGLIRAGLADRLTLHRAPLLIGGDGTPVLATLGVDRIAEAPRLRLLERQQAGDDLLETFEMRAGPG